MSHLLPLNRFPSLMAGCSDLTLSRIVDLTAPFLLLHAQTAPLAAPIMACHKMYSLWTEEASSLSKAQAIAFQLSQITFAYFCPLGGLILANAMTLTHQIHRLQAASSQEEQVQVVMELINQGLQLSAKYYGSPALTAVSLLSQTACDFCTSYQQSQVPEMLAALLLGTARIQQASAYLSRSNHFKEPAKDVVTSSEGITIQETVSSASPPLKKLTNEEWQLFYHKHLSCLPPDFQGRVDLYTLLMLNNFSGTLENIDFSQTPQLHKISFTNLTCYHCNFEKVFFSSSMLQEFSAHHCNFKGATFQATIVKCFFENCDLTEIKSGTYLTTGSNKFDNCLGGYLLGNAPSLYRPIEEIHSTPLKPMTQNDLNDLIPHLGKPRQNAEAFDFSQFLKQKGFSNELHGLNFRSCYITTCIFSDLKFVDCDFTQSHFHKCLFSDITANNCTFRSATWSVSWICNTTFTKCNFSNAIFKNPFYHASTLIKKEIKNSSTYLHNIEFTHNCNLDHTTFQYACLDEVKFFSSSLKKAFFRLSSIKNCLFFSCDLAVSAHSLSTYENTLFNECALNETIWSQSSMDHLMIQKSQLTECCFVDTDVKDSHLLDSDLKNALLLDAKEGFQIHGGTANDITKPIIALGWSFDTKGYYTDLIRKSLQDCGVLVLKYDQTKPKMYRHEEEDLKHSFLQKITSFSPFPDNSRAQEVLNMDSPLVQEALRSSKAILKHADGLVIPGGVDFPRFIYDNVPPESSMSADDLFRGLLDIALLKETHEKQLPTLGICRGAQAINIYFGGTLLQDVEGQVKLQTLEWTKSPYSRDLQNILPNKFAAESNHHQAVDQVGKGLHVVLKKDNIPKLLVSEDGNYIASQFHPESYIERLMAFTHKYRLSNFSIVEENIEQARQFNKKVQQVFSQFQNSNFTQTYAHIMFKTLKQHNKLIEFIFYNKQLYRFFLNKVEAYKKKKSNFPSPEEAG